MTEQLICSEFLVHEDVVKQVKCNMPSVDTIHKVTELFKVFGDSTRMQILSVLSVHELCVCDIVKLLGISQSAVSHQLRVLKDAHLVKSVRSGKTIAYSLADDHVKGIFAQATEHVNEESEEDIDVI